MHKAHGKLEGIRRLKEMAPRKFKELYKAGKVACPFPYLRDEDGASPRMISCVDLEHSLCCTLIWDSQPQTSREPRLLCCSHGRSDPVSAQTFRATCTFSTAMKRRGGTGVNLAFGICVAMIYVFVRRHFESLGSRVQSLRRVGIAFATSCYPSPPSTIDITPPIRMRGK